jgi:hypothetical protein
MWLPLSTGVEPAELANSASIPRRPTASIHRHRATSIGAQGERAGRKALSELDTNRLRLRKLSSVRFKSHRRGLRTVVDACCVVDESFDDAWSK